MNAVEIRNLTKKFKSFKTGEKVAVDNFNMTVPQGAIYGFIGENGSGKSTTEKMICGLLIPNGGEIKLFGKPHTDADVRAKVGCIIEMPGCFPNMSVWDNMLLQAANLNIKNPQEQVRKVLTMVHMEGSASNKFKNCSLGMRQRIGIAFALLGDPKLLVLDEPINGLDADGMRIMREILTEVSSRGTTVIISSHILSELEKIATHYGIIKNGKMIAEMTAEELENDCPTYVSVMTKRQDFAQAILSRTYARVEKDENDYLRVYNANCPEDIVELLHKEDITVSEIKTAKIGLEEYYLNLTHGAEVR